MPIQIICNNVSQDSTNTKQRPQKQREPGEITMVTNEEHIQNLKGLLQNIRTRVNKGVIYSTDNFLWDKYNKELKKSLKEQNKQ